MMMDQLFKRYADPFSLLTGYIQTSRFCEFIKGFVEQVAEDKLWDFYLHRVWNQSYDDFCETAKTTQDLKRMSEDDMGATLKQSMNILGNFNPNAEGGEM